jgi:hypothetical protein
MSDDGRPTIVVVDPCLEAPGSHPHRYAVDLLGAALRKGWGRVLVCRQGSRLQAEGIGGAEVLPLLRFPGASKLTAFAELDRLDDRGRPRWQLPWSAARRRWQRAERVSAFAADLAPIVARLRPGDHLLVATASELDALGLAGAIAATRPPPGIGWHLQFHGPLLAGPLPAGATTAAAGDRRLGRVRHALDSAIATAAPHPLRFHCPTEELAAEWQLAGAEGASLLRYCVDVSVAPPQSSANRRLRLATLGDARAEKNSQSVAAVVDSITTDRELRGRLRFAFQSNPGFAARSVRPGDVAIRRAIASLGAYDNDLVECLAGPLDQSSYRRQIELADAILLPYDQSRYRQRCSAILLEALCGARVPIVTAGGWMARQLVPAIRAHAAAIADRHSLPTDPDWHRLPMSGVGAGGWGVSIPPRADCMLVEARWRATGHAALLAPAARIGIARGGTDRSAILQADPSGEPVQVAIRLMPGPVGAERGDAAILSFAATTPRHPIDLATLRIKWLHGGARMATSAAGIIIPGVDELEDGIREFVAHADHYLHSAAALSPSVRHSHAPDSILETLIA